MKRSIVLLLLVTILFSTSVFASDLDFTSYSIEELVDLRNRIIEELNSRGYSEKELLPTGPYIAGEDIAVGQYIISPASEDVRVALYVYENEESYSEFYASETLIVENNTVRVNLKEGNILYVQSNSGDAYIEKGSTSSIFNP